MLAALLVGLTLAAPVAAGNARCSPPRPKDLASPASFAGDLVGSLARALEGTRRIDVSRSQAASDLIPAVGLVKDDFACAGRFVAPYEKSRNASVRTAARNLAKRYEALTRSLDGQLTWLRYLDGKSRAGREPDPARSDALLERAVREKDAAAEALAIAAVEALDTVVELRDGKPTGRLQLTGAERRALEAEILKKFGDSVRSGPSTENDFATNAASAWFRVLSDGSYRATDET